MLHPWLSARMAATGWASWPALARRAGLNRSQLAQLQGNRLPEDSVQPLARALSTTPVVLRRVEAGQRISPRLRRPAPAALPMDPIDWPPFDAGQTPCVGIAHRDGSVELMPDAQTLPALSMPAAPGVFALRICFAPLDDHHRLYRAIPTDTLPLNADIACYLNPPDADPAAHIGRLLDTDADGITLQRPNNRRLKFPHAHLLHLAREISTMPAPLGSQ